MRYFDNIYIENVSHVIAATETFPDVSSNNGVSRQDWFGSRFFSVGCTKRFWAEAADGLCLPLHRCLQIEPAAQIYATAEHHISAQGLQLSNKKTKQKTDKLVK